MPAFNLGRPLPPPALLLPAAVLALVGVVLLAVVLGEGRAIHDSGLAANTTQIASATHAATDDAPLPTSRAPDATLAALATSELFGHYDPTSAAAGAATPTKPAGAVLGEHAPNALPEATLALKLQGIIFKRDPAQRRAIIAGDGPLAEARKVGETLLGDAVIRYIDLRRVVIEQHGELKALSLVEPVLGANGGGQTPATIDGLAGGPSRYGVPPQGIRRGASQPPADAPQPYEEPPSDEVDEPPPDSIDNGVSTDEQGSEPEQPEPTE